MRIKDCSKCKFKCSEKISEEQRQQIFNSYWNLQSHDRQRDYICDHVLEKFKAGVKKKVARSFTFHINGEIVRVCRSYFTSTLGIGRKTVECALTRQSMSSAPMDKIGKSTPHNKTPDADLDAVNNNSQWWNPITQEKTQTDNTSVVI